MDLNDMMVFLTVVESGSFTAAADRLDMPKANISRKIAKLEAQLGVTLLQRTTRTQHLTEAGKRYLLHCKRIHEELDLAEACVSELSTSLRGDIKVGASVTMGQQILRPALSEFLRTYPDINLQLSLTNKRVNLIEQGFDVLIRIGALEDSTLVAKKLGSVRRHLYASPDFFKKKAAPDGLDALGECDFLIMTDSYRSTILLESDGQSREIKVLPRLLVDDFLMLRQATLDGLGIALLPDYMCNDALNSSTLIKVLPQWSMPASDVFALYPKHRASIPKVRAFIDFAAEVCRRSL